ncbi:LysR family transcriptional regulator [Fodinicola feengrottensis]|uniref:LysR family transcriptional regulator n=1 Tax=Fodinicola feengrottensis TaxID=435914 RepID=A0ABN2GQJ4_9ACTN
MPVVSLDLLRTFHAVYRARTLTRAALELGLSQPTVTSQLRSLEQAVDQPLFTRQARGVVPTAAADDLARRLDGPLDALVGIAAELGRSPALAGRTLHLGGPAELVAVRALPALAGTIAAGVAVRTSLGLADDLLADLADGRLDLVISTVRPRRRGLHYEPLCDEEFVLVAAPTVLCGLDLAGNRTKALQGLPLLAYAEDLPIIRRWWRHVLGVPPTGRAVLVAPDLRALRAAAAAGIGVTVLPRYLCAEDLTAGRLVEILPTEDPPINTFYLASRTPARQDPHLAHAWDALLDAAKSW